jgi:hypothetical protein
VSRGIEDGLVAGHEERAGGHAESTGNLTHGTVGSCDEDPVTVHVVAAVHDLEREAIVGVTPIRLGVLPAEGDLPEVLEANLLGKD